MGERMTVRLVGGGPWGFRLQGGSGAPLTVSKIRRRSRAQHHLVEGDHILSINGVSCSQLNYDQAMAVVDSADNSLHIEIIRGGAGGKENRDPSAISQPPRETATKDKASLQTVTTKTKTQEPATKTSFDAVEVRSQAPKITDSTKPSSMVPQPAPKPMTSFPEPVSTPLVPEFPTYTAEPKIKEPEVPPFSFKQPVTAPEAQLFSFQHPAVAPEATPFTSAPTGKEQLTTAATKPLFPEAPPFYSTTPISLPVSTSSKTEVMTQKQEVRTQKQEVFTQKQEVVAQKQEVRMQETLSKRDSLPVTSSPVPDYPTAMNLAPELEALAPELMALDSELAAFASASAPLSLTKGEPEASQRRQEVSVETTSDGQRYKSLTTETSSWSEGPQHKAASFQQKEETKEVGHLADDKAEMTGITGTVHKETKVFRSSKVETSSTQNQLSPDECDALSWRPTSPIFQKPLQPPLPTIARTSVPSPTPPPYSVPKTTVKDAPASAVWSPPSASAPVEKKKKKVPPPTPPKPSRKARSPPPTQPRPISAPPRDFDIWDTPLDAPLQGSGSRVGRSTEFSNLTSATASDSEDWYHHYGPLSSEDEMGSSSLFTRRKKMFSSSSFYEEPHCIYPTVEEQVELARKIAGSLSNDNNKKSRGANMFFKRVKRSHTWIHEGPEPYSDGGTTDTDMEPTTPDPGSGPYIKVSTGPPKLKLILDPRQLQDLVKLRSSGQNPVEHTAVSPDICMDLVRDLNSPRGKGAALFAKRKQKALEWVVDGEKVKYLIAQKDAEIAQLQQEGTLPFSASFNSNVVLQNRLKLIKSPWEAALESPIGSCDSAFVELPPVRAAVASSIIRAAENKARIAPVAAPYTETPYSLPSDVYRPKAPRGWMGSTTGSVPSTELEPLASEAPHMSQSSRPSTGAPRPHSFHDFNTVARSWTAAARTPPARSFHTVRAPNVK